VPIWQHNKRVLGHIFTAHAQKIWPRHSLRRPRLSHKTDAFPLPSDVYGIYSMFLCYCVAWPCDPDLFDYERVSCTVLLVSDPHTNFYYPTTIGYWVTSRAYWIFDHISVIWNSHCACAVSRDLCIGGPPKPHLTIFWPQISYSLYNFYEATMTIKVVYIGASPC